MPTARSPRRAPLAALLLAAATAGCGPGPFTRAASAYAGANEKSAAALSTAPSTAYSVCRKKARVGYLQVRLGLLSTPEPIPWNTWYATAKATDKQTWEQYCGAMQSTGKVFAVAVGALRQYGAALKTLADGGTYDGTDIQATADAASVIAASLGSEGASGAIKPVGPLLGQFAGFLFQDVTEDKIEDYVRRADPLVQPLVEDLEKYVDAVDAELRLTESSQRQTLRGLEVRGGLEEPLAEPAMLIAFYDFALATEDDIQQTRAVLDGYKGVLVALRAAHGAMVKAGSREDELELKRSLGAVFNLLTQVQTLDAALAKKE